MCHDVISMHSLSFDRTFIVFMHAIRIAIDVFAILVSSKVKCYTSQSIRIGSVRLGLARQGPGRPESESVQREATGQPEPSPYIGNDRSRSNPNPFPKVISKSFLTNTASRDSCEPFY